MDHAGLLIKCMEHVIDNGMDTVMGACVDVFAKPLVSGSELVASYRDDRLSFIIITGKLAYCAVVLDAHSDGLYFFGLMVDDGEIYENTRSSGHIEERHPITGDQKDRIVTWLEERFIPLVELKSI